MLQSHVIEIDGAFVGAAIPLEQGYRFVAIDLRVEEMASRTWPTLADIQRVARGLYRIGIPKKPIERLRADTRHAFGPREAGPR